MLPAYTILCVWSSDRNDCPNIIPHPARECKRAAQICAPCGLSARSNACTLSLRPGLHTFYNIRNTIYIRLSPLGLCICIFCTCSNIHCPLPNTSFPPALLIVSCKCLKGFRHIVQRPFIPASFVFIFPLALAEASFFSAKASDNTRRTIWNRGIAQPPEKSYTHPPARPR